MIAGDGSIRRHGLGHVAQGVRRGWLIGRIPNAYDERRLGAVRYLHLLKTHIESKGRIGNQAQKDGHHGETLHVRLLIFFVPTFRVER